MSERIARTIRGYFAVGIYHPKHEQNIGTLWRTASSLGAAFVFTVGRRYQKQASDTTKAWRHVPLFHFDDVDSLVHHLPYSCPLVGVELQPDAVPIERYGHLERACYMLGAEDHGIPADVSRRCHETVVLPGLYCHNVAVAGALVMYDRISKGIAFKPDAMLAARTATANTKE